MTITHTQYLKHIYLIKDLPFNEKSLLIFLFHLHFNLGFKTKDLYKTDKYIQKTLDISINTLRTWRKTLREKNYISTYTSNNGVHYIINYDKILNTTPSSTDTEITPAPQSTKTEEYSTPNSTNILLPPTPLTTTKEEEIEENYTPQSKDETKIDFKDIFSDFESISPQNDISISNETKVSEITQNHPLNEDEYKEVNLAFNKDNKINENNEDMGEVKIGVLENLVSAFTKEELILWQDTLKNGNDTEFIESAANRVNSIAAEYRLKEEYVWRKLIEYVTTTQFETKPVEEIVNENEVDLDTIPAWIWDTLERVYVQNVKETEKNMWGDDVEVINRYLRPMEVIRPIYKMTLKKHSTEDKALLNRYAKIVYDDCAFAYKEYDKEIAA